MSRFWEGSEFWQQWWRLGGVFGIAWAVLFIIGAIILQGETPSRDDSIEEIRQYFTDDAEMYLIGDYLLGIAFVVFFLPFVVCLRWFLGAAEGWPPILSWLTAIGGVVTAILGAVAGFFWGALALGAADHEEVDDSSVRTLMELDVFAFTALGFGMMLFVGAASLIMLRTGIVWRWLGGLGLLAAVLLLIGGAWPIDGDEEGVIAIFGFAGSLGVAIWIILTSVAMIIRREEPAATERAG